MNRDVGAIWRWARSILRVPLFYKIFLANVTIVILGAVAGTWLTVKVARGNPTIDPLELIVTFAGIGAVLSAFANAVVLHIALSPLRSLERTARRIGDGEKDVRVPRSPIADRQLDRLAATFNQMLDSLGRYRRRLRAVAVRVTEAAERERMKVAGELQNETAERLRALEDRALRLRQSEDRACRDHQLREIGDELREVADRVERLARRLRPAALDERGLVGAVRDYARVQSEAYRTAVRVDAGAEPRLSEERAVAVYRIVQEALSNALRHAGADEVRIRLEATADGLHLTVVDDGRGFDLERVMTSEDRGLGLSDMQERASHMGGRVRIESEENGGTRVTVRVPTEDDIDGP